MEYTSGPIAIETNVGCTWRWEVSRKGDGEVAWNTMEKA